MSRTPVETEIETVAVVVALTDLTASVGACLARFADEVGPRGEVVVVDGTGGNQAQDLARPIANARVLRRPRGQLAPVLWRDGLLATDAPLVAFTTAQMIPGRGWLAALTARLRGTGAVGVGGPIEPGPGLSATGRAVAMLRYSGYFPPLPDPSRVDPPGDNALYRRDRLMEVESAWREGFLEVDVHRALRDRGETLAMDESAAVSFEGGIGLAPMIRQRWAHARRFGAGRSRGLGASARLARTFVAPLVPARLCGRIVAALRVRRMALSPWLPALPGLAVLASTWAVGEAVGTWKGGEMAADARTRPMVTHPGPDGQGQDSMTVLTGEAR